MTPFALSALFIALFIALSHGGNSMICERLPYLSHLNPPAYTGAPARARLHT